MSFWDSVAATGEYIDSMTYGTIYRALTGNLDPASVALLKTQNAESVKEAMPGADPSTVQATIDSQNAQIDEFLQSIGSDPNQATLRTPLGVSPSLAFLFGNSTNDALSEVGKGQAESQAAGTSSANAETAVADWSKRLLLLAAIGLGVYVTVQVVSLFRNK
jgi:hypothetical protein